MYRREHGFTLVELMVVVLIIGILVAVAVPVFKAAKADAEKQTCYANQRAIEGAAQAWLAENPDKTGGQLSSDSLGATPYGSSPVPGYFKKAPYCPSLDPVKFHYYWWPSATYMVYPVYLGGSYSSFGGCWAHWYYAGAGTVNSHVGDWGALPPGTRPANPWQ